MITQNEQMVGFSLPVTIEDENNRVMQAVVSAPCLHHHLSTHKNHTVGPSLWQCHRQQTEPECPRHLEQGTQETCPGKVEDQGFISATPRRKPPCCGGCPH
jgi:hypothetical protein